MVDPRISNVFARPVGEDLRGIVEAIISDFATGTIDGSVLFWRDTREE